MQSHTCTAMSKILYYPCNFHSTAHANRNTIFRTQLCRRHMNESSFRHGRPWQVASAGPNVKPRRGAHLSRGVMTSPCSVNRAMTFLMVMFLQNKYINIKKMANFWS